MDVEEIEEQSIDLSSSDGNSNIGGEEEDNDGMNGSVSQCIFYWIQPVLYLTCGQASMLYS
jgi:hypothetical protein